MSIRTVLFLVMISIVLNSCKTSKITPTNSTSKPESSNVEEIKIEAETIAFLDTVDININRLLKDTV